MMGLAFVLGTREPSRVDIVENEYEKLDSDRKKKSELKRRKRSLETEEPTLAIVSGEEEQKTYSINS